MWSCYGEISFQMNTPSWNLERFLKLRFPSTVSWYTINLQSACDIYVLTVEHAHNIFVYRKMPEACAHRCTLACKVSKVKHVVANVGSPLDELSTFVCSGVRLLLLVACYPLVLTIVPHEPSSLPPLSKDCWSVLTQPSLFKTNKSDHHYSPFAKTDLVHHG